MGGSEAYGSPFHAADPLQGLVDLQSARIEELETEVVLLRAENADLQALLIARDDEVYCLKEELETQRGTTKKVIKEVQNDPVLQQERRDLHETKIDLAVTRIGCQWQQIIEDKTNLYMAQDAEEIAAAQVQLARSQVKLELTQEELVRTCLSGDLIPLQQAAESSVLSGYPWPDRRGMPQPTSPLGHKEPPTTQTDSLMFDLSTDPTSEGLLIEEEAMSAMDDSQSVGFQLPKPVFPHPEQLPRGISLTKKKFDRACAAWTEQKNVSVLFTVDDSLTWTTYPNFGEIAMPSKRLNKAGQWLDQSAEIMGLVQVRAKQLLLQQDGRVSYLGSYLIWGPTRTALSLLSEERRAHIIEKTLFNSVSSTPGTLEKVRKEYASGALHVAVFELRRITYNSNVERVLLSAGGQWVGAQG